MGTIVRAVVAYVVLLFMIRITTRRAAGPATPFELILIFLFGGMTIQSVVADDRSMTGAILGVTTIAWMHVAVSYLKRRFSGVGLVTDGSPVVLVDAGAWQNDRLARLRLSEQDVMASARERGLERRDQIRHAVYERNGVISIVPHDDDSDGRREG